MKIGFIGLGIMGRPLSKHLVNAGFDVMVSDVNPDPVKELVSLGASTGTYAEIGEQCEVVITILPTGGIVQSVLFDEGGIASTIKPGSLVIDHSSVSPVESRECYDKLKEKGVDFVDAPVSGGEPGAVAGTLAIMCGGEEKDFERLKPFFERVGSSALT